MSRPEKAVLAGSDQLAINPRGEQCAISVLGLDFGEAFASSAGPASSRRRLGDCRRAILGLPRRRRSRLLRCRSGLTVGLPHTSLGWCWRRWAIYSTTRKSCRLDCFLVAQGRCELSTGCSLVGGWGRLMALPTGVSGVPELIPRGIRSDSAVARRDGSVGHRVEFDNG